MVSSFKRERFNSEGTTKAFRSYNSYQDDTEELEIDMSNIKYPMKGNNYLK
jgi:hypothetical protein